MRMMIIYKPGTECVSSDDDIMSDSELDYDPSEAEENTEDQDLDSGINDETSTDMLNIDTTGHASEIGRSTYQRDCKGGEDYTRPPGKLESESWDLMLNRKPLMPRVEFFRTVKEITRELTGKVGRRKDGFRWRSKAVETLQYYTEDFISEVLNRSMMIASNAKRKTCNVNDIQTYMKVSGKQLEAFKEFHREIREMCANNDLSRLEDIIEENIKREKQEKEKEKTGEIDSND